MALEQLNLQDGLDYAFCSDLGGYHVFMNFLALFYRVPVYHSIETLDFTFCSKKDLSMHSVAPTSLYNGIELCQGINHGGWKINPDD